MSLAHELKLPYPPLLLRVLRISVVVWVLVRITYVVVLLGGVLFFGFLSLQEGIDAALHPVWPSRVLLVVLTGFLVWRQRTIDHEHLLQGNFGVLPAWFSAASLLAAGAADLTVQALLRSF